jgi:flagellar biosynthesis protein
MNGLPGKQEALATALITGLARKTGDSTGDSAQLMAQGRGALAAQIAEVAGKHNIPVLQDFALSQALQKMPVGTQIPDPLFRALAGLLEFVFRQEEALAREHDEQE